MNSSVKEDLINLALDTRDFEWLAQILNNEYITPKDVTKNTYPRKYM